MRFSLRFQSLLPKMFIPRTRQYTRDTEWTEEKKTGVRVRVCVHIQEYAKDFHIKNMAIMSQVPVFCVGNGAT